jgi:hypothetical protein
MQQWSHCLYGEHGKVAVMAEAAWLAAGQGLPHDCWPVVRQLGKAYDPLATGAGAIARPASPAGGARRRPRRWVAMVPAHRVPGGTGRSRQGAPVRDRRQ